MHAINTDLLKHHLPQLLNLADAFDLSFSMSDHGTERRALIGWYTANASMDVLCKVCCDWGIPLPIVQQWRQQAVGTEGVGITFNQELTSVRLYTHKWMGVSLEDVGTSVYKGFKLLKDQSLRLDDYVNFGDLRSNNNLAYAMSLGQHPHWVNQLHQLAPSDAPLLFTRTSNTSRQSWLVTARYAEIEADVIAGPAFTGHKLLHLAGGIDAVKGSFSTIYIQTTLDEVADFIEGKVFPLDLDVPSA